jgi:hypothetical protein
MQRMHLTRWQEDMCSMGVLWRTPLWSCRLETICTGEAEGGPSGPLRHSKRSKRRPPPGPHAIEAARAEAIPSAALITGRCQDITFLFPNGGTHREPRCSLLARPCSDMNFAH